MDCGKITHGFIGGACGTALPIGGTGTEVVLLNYSDVVKDASGLDEVSGIISKITLKDGAKGFLFQSLENSTEGSATLSAGTYVDTYDHSVTLRIFKDTAEAKAWVNSMKGARFIAIVGKRTTGKNHWEVFGWDSGLKLSENAYNTTFTDNVALSPVISSDDTSKESSLPFTFFADSEKETDAAIYALCQEPAV